MTKQAHHLHRRTIRHIAAATSYLAAGFSRADTAALVGCSVATLRSWKRRHPAVWKAKFDLARSKRAMRPAQPIVTVSHHTPVQPAPDTLLAFFEQVYRPQRLLGRAPATVREYRSVVVCFSRWAGRAVKLAELSDQLVVGYMEGLLASGRAPATVNKCRRTLLAIWRFAHRRKLVGVLPDVARLREVKRIPEAWSMDELAAIVEACRAEPGMIAAIPAGQWWEAFVLTLYDSGLRVSALLQAERRALSLSEGVLRVPGEAQKQKADQTFQLHPDTLAALRPVASYSLGKLFPWPCAFKTLERRYRGILRRAGLPSDRRCLFHRIRRTTATHLCDRLGIGVVQEYLGHASSTTTKAYVDPSKVHQVVAVDVLPRPDGNGTARMPTTEGPRMADGNGRHGSAGSEVGHGSLTTD